MFTGRIGDSKGHKEIYVLHRWVSIITGIAVIFTFIFMILPPFFTGSEIVLGIHGWIAVIALIMVVSQIIVSLIIKDRSRIRIYHRYFGYILMILLSMQGVIGLILVII